MSNYARPAIGHMPFPGHRTVAEWNRPYGTGAKKSSDLLSPAPNGATWPCGHPKTEANTQSVGDAGFRCRLCRRAISRKCGSKVRGA